jgi:hypothetical protein
MDKLSVFRRLRANPEKYVPMSVQEVVDAKTHINPFQEKHITVVFLRHDVACSGILTQFYEDDPKYLEKLRENEGFIPIVLREAIAQFRPEFRYLFGPVSTRRLRLPVSSIVDANMDLDEAPNFDCFAVFSEGRDRMPMRYEHINFFKFAREEDDRFRYVDPDGYVAREIMNLEGKGHNFYNMRAHFEEYPPFLFSSNEPLVLDMFLSRATTNHNKPLYRQLSGEELNQRSAKAKVDFSRKSGKQKFDFVVVNPIYNMYQRHQTRLFLRSANDSDHPERKKIHFYPLVEKDRDFEVVGYLNLLDSPDRRTDPRSLVVFEVLNKSGATKHLETLPKAPTNYEWKTGDVADIKGAVAPMASIENANAVARATSSSAASQLPVSAKRVRSNPPHAWLPDNQSDVISISSSGTPPAVRPRFNDGDAAVYYVDSRTPSPMVVDDDDDDDVVIIESPKYNDNNNNYPISKRPKTKRGGWQRRKTAKRRQHKAYRIQRSTRRRWIK